MRERLVVVGGDAAGMSAASQARRRKSPSELEIVALEKGNWTSYSACGIPYLVSGDVGGLDDLVARTPEQHRANGIKVRMRSEATAVDLDKRRVEVRDHEDDRTYWLDFDVLHIATGAVPFRPPIDGIDLPFVHAVQTLGDAAHLLDHARNVDLRHVVVVGGGYIGLEMAEAFLKRGQHVTIVEALPQVMSTLDPDMGALVGDAARGMGIDLHLGEQVTGFSVGTAMSKLCDLEAARSGLQEREAQQAGFDYVVAKIESTTKAGYFPGTQPMTMKMLAERRSGRLLGAQIVGREGSAKRIDAIATALTAEMTVEEMTGLDLSYAPPFAPVWDPILVAARKCAELLEGEP